MEVRDKNSNNNQQKNINKEGKKNVKPFKFSSNNKTVNETKPYKGFKDRKDEEQSLSKPQKCFSSQSSFQNSKDKQSSVFNKSFRNNDLWNNYSKDDDDLDLSRRSKPRDWRKQKQKQRKDALELQDYSLMDINTDKIQRQQEWEEKRKKNKGKNKDKKRNKKFFDDYEGYNDWENDEWN